MASAQQEKLLDLLAGESGPIATSELAKKALLTTESTAKQLKRLAGKELVVRDEEGKWSITEAGREELIKLPSEDEIGATDYERFNALGKRIGVSERLVDVTTEHVWAGGDYRDLNWVWNAFGEMGIRQDLKPTWWNAWRSFLKQGIPPELKEEVSKAAGGEPGQVAPVKKPSADYILIEDEPVRVGEGLGDYSLQDAKDILAMRAIKSRFERPDRGGTDLSGTGEKLSDIITALAPYLSKDTDPETAKEMLGDKLTLLKQEIMSGLPRPTQPKSFMEQAIELIGILGTLKDSGPLLRSILGIPEPSTNPPTSNLPVPMTDKDGNPILTVDLLKFVGDEKRADEKIEQLKLMVESFREKVAPAAAIFLGRVAESKAPAAEAETPQRFEGSCPSCGQTISLDKMPAGEFPCPHCKAILNSPA